MSKIQVTGAPKEKKEKNRQAKIINKIIQENVQDQRDMFPSFKKLTKQTGQQIKINTH